jgi:group I intron endonuclease
MQQIINTGIYCIRNIINNKIYIGSSCNIKKRFRYHKWQLNNNRHHSFLLQNAWNKYGENSFVFEVLQEVETHLLITEEQKWLDEKKTYQPENGYNISNIAGNPLNLFTEETRKKISLKNKGKIVSEETRKKMSASRLGKSLSEEHKKKLSEIKKGKTFSEEHKKNLSNSQIGLTRQFSEEHKKKLSEAKKGKCISSEHKEKISLTSRGRNSKLTTEQIIELISLYETGNHSTRELAKIFNISKSNVHSIVARKTWKYLDDKPEGTNIN